MSRARPLALAALAVAATPTAAQAHLVATGLGPLYDGAAHVGLSPEDLLPVAALGLHAGLRGPARSRRLLAVLTSAWIVGGALGLAGCALDPVATGVATAALFLAIGALLALDVDRAPAVGIGSAALLGLVRGGADLTRGGSLTAAAGAAAAAFVVFALSASLSLPLTRAWTRVAARVAGSWLAAAGLLLAGWIVRYGARAA